MLGFEAVGGVPEAGLNNGVKLPSPEADSDDPWDENADEGVFDGRLPAAGAGGIFSSCFFTGARAGGV